LPKMASADPVADFCAITGADRDLGSRLLEACGGNLEMAVNMHMEDAGGGAGPANHQVAPAPGGASLGDEDDVRAPIAPRADTMVAPGFEGYAMNNRSNSRTNNRRVRTVFDGFRNFEEETRRLEAGLDSVDTGSRDPPGVSQSKKKTLEELFKPPLDLMHQGDWQSARDTASSSGRWLLVNIQDSREFQCQVLNRDLWSNPAVKSIVGEHFVFWQQYKESDEAERYMTFYQIDKWPYVSVIDPRTGENMVTWNKINASAFPELMTEFLTNHPSLESPAKEPPRKKARTGSILEQDEEAQMAAAIKASLGDALASTIEEEEDADLETFTDDEASNLSPRKYENGNNDGGRLNGVNVCKNGDSGKGKRKFGEVGGGEANGENGGDDEEEDYDWKKYLGLESDPVAKVMIRFPDGSREIWKHPETSKLKALVIFVQSKGYALEDHEIVTNFPRRVVTDLQLSDTLREAGLAPQETVFVQLKD